MNICMIVPARGDPQMPVYPGVEILAYMANLGHSITIIISGQDSQNFDNIFLDTVTTIKVLYSGSLDVDSFWKLLTQKIPHLIKRQLTLLKTVHNSHFDIVIVRDNVLDGLLAVYLKRKNKMPFVYSQPNPLEQMWETIKHEKQRKPRFIWFLIAKVHEIVGMYVLRNSDLILAMSDNLKKHLVNKRLNSAKIITVPAGVDTTLFSPDIDNADIIKRYNLYGYRKILYIGTLSKARRLDILIKAFSIVKPAIPDSKLILVGEGNDRPNLKLLASDLGIENDVIFTGQVSRKEIPAFIAAADIGISMIPPTFSYLTSSPLKTLEYLAMGKPVVANCEIPEQREVLEQSKVGILVNYSAEDFASGIVQLMKNPELASTMGKLEIEWVRNNRSYERLARQVEAELLNLLSQSKHN